MAKKYDINDIIQKTSKLAIEEKSDDEISDDEESDDEDYYGLQGLSPNAILYRVCRADEDTNEDIVCKASPGTDAAKRTVNQHINSGGWKPSRFISTTASYDAAKDWATYTKKDRKNVLPRPGGPLPIIKIYLSRMKGMEALDDLINLTNPEVRKHFVSGATQINRVKSSQEVLFQWRLPKKNGKLEDVFVLC